MSLRLRCLAAALLAFAVLSTSVGCKSTGQTTDRAAPAADTALPFEPDDLIARVEALRDREFDRLPAFERVDQPLDVDDDGSPPPEPVQRDRTLLSRALFGIDAPERPALPHEPALETIAHFDRENHRIRVHPGGASPDIVRTATVHALVTALDAAHFDPLPPADSWDRALATRAVAHGDATFVNALLAAGRDGSTSLPADTLAARPELVGRLAPLETLLDASGDRDPEMIDDPRALQTRLRAFTLREGLSLTAAFFRAGRWSGVELLRSIPPRSTADVIRPDRWMKGESLGNWSWPSPSENTSWSLAHSGRIGPALASIWIGQRFPARLARTVYSGWASDAYRWWTHTGDTSEDTDTWRFEWISLWSTVSGARQITKAFERVLDAEAARDGRTISTDVLRRGLKVVVIIENKEPNAQRIASLGKRAAALSDASVTFQPQRPLPLSFKPTRQEAFRTLARRADLDAEAFTDPATKLRVDLAAVADWTVRASRTLPLRWFARHPDGAVLQLTTELADPLGPNFGSEAYLDELHQAFRSSFASAELSDTDTLQTPLAPTFTFALTGKRNADDQTPTKLRLWQSRRGDLIVTLSLQSTAETFEKRRQTAETLLKSIETTGSVAPTPSDSKEEEADDDGTIEYEIEDSE